MSMRSLVELSGGVTTHYPAANATDRGHTAELPNSQEFAPELSGSQVS